MRPQEDLDYAIKGMNFRVEGGENVAIIGTAASGKSSILNSLLRIF